MRPIESPESSLTKTALKIYPPPSEELAIENLYTDLELPSEGSLDSSLPYLYTNMVSTLDGKIAIEGKANDIGEAGDRRVMRNLRAISDGVLRTGSTLRAEKILSGVPHDLSIRRVDNGLSPQPFEIILTKTADVSILQNLIDYDPTRTILLTGERSEPLDLTLTLRDLKEKHHIRRLLMESGPTLNYSLVSQNLLDEIFLTISPKLVAGLPAGSLNILTGELLPREAQVAPRLLSVHTMNNELFLRYSLR
jgi:2,5-diamino-6-(ribosylamino)-4(3H)-pyrimidinone 5'-phosphate reductase